ncbi:site-specific integrase [uncultured Mailhella sp.]|uniref:tyrosine-type recombinase/integrase n=1 Tax=uncultured Mailhella sp. TaxID=1981031 RepID=UPI00261EF411|nr:site-specific integrase [uncultured Mailhella sp.]
MSDVTSRKYIKTKFEGVFYRLSSKIRNPKTGEPDRIYCFCYTDAQGKGHWKTVGRHSEGIRPPMVKSERAKFIAEIASTGINPATRDNVTIGQLVDAYLAWGRSEGKYVDQHYSQYKAHLKAKIHDLPVSALSSGLLSNLKAELLATPTGNTKSKKGGNVKSRGRAKPRKTLAGQTVNNIFSFMRSAINRAIATGAWSGVNPLSTKSGTWKMVKANNERLRFLTREEAKALLDDLEKRHPQLHDMALLSLRTGLRPTEIFKLRGQDVDGNACGLYIIQKGGKRVFVRVPEDMIQMLQAYKRKPAEPIFQQPRKRTAFDKTPACFQTAVRKLNLAPKDGDSLYAVTLHTMRHTFASWLAQSGKVSLMELQKLMRHKNITMTMRYAHLFPGQENEKLSIIGDMLA